MVLGIYGSGGAGQSCRDIADLMECWSEIVFIDDTVPADIFMGSKRMPFENFLKEFPPPHKLRS